MEAIVKIILGRSVVTVEHIKIVKATPEYAALQFPLSFTMGQKRSSC